MNQYTVPSKRARDIFFLVLIILVAIIVLDQPSNNQLITHHNLQETLHELAQHSFNLLLITIGFYSLLSAGVIYLSHRTIKTKQWPPAGLPVPFKIRIYKVSKPLYVWLFCAVLLACYSLHIFVAFMRWRETLNLLATAGIL